MNRRKTPSAPRDLRSSGAPTATILLGALCILATGCANRQLQFSAAGQARTVVDLQYQQILDNMAMFCLNPSALPSLSFLKTGATQVGDTGTLGFLGTAGLNTTFGSSPTVAGTRTIVDQWGSSPLTDDNNLLLVRKAFRSALGFHDLLNEDDANDLAHDLSAQIGTTSDMSVDRDTQGHLFSQGLVTGTLARLMPPERTRRNPPPGTSNRESLVREQRRELEELAGRLAEVNELINRDFTDTLDGNILTRAVTFENNSHLDVDLLKDARELPEEGEDCVYVAQVGGGLRLRIFIGEEKPVYDLQVMASVTNFNEEPEPEFRNNLIIMMYGTEQISGEKETPQFRIYGANGEGVVGAGVVPMTQPEVVSKFVECCARPHSTEAPSDSEKNRIISTVLSATDRTREKIQELIKICDRAGRHDTLYASDKRQIARTVVEIVGLTGRLKERFEPLASSSTGLAKETIYRVNDAQKTLDEVQAGWFRSGPEKPKDACYVGHARFCGQECYVWVCRDGLENLEEFTRKVLKLGTTLKDVQVVTAPSGIQFAPALTNTSR